MAAKQNICISMYGLKLHHNACLFFVLIIIIIITSIKGTTLREAKWQSPQKKERSKYKDYTFNYNHVKKKLKTNHSIVVKIFSFVVNL